jgi:hypothetical protein
MTKAPGRNAGTFRPDLSSHRTERRKDQMEHTTHDKIAIGPRTRREVELRIRELQSRYHLAPRDHMEISRLQEFLRTVAPRDGKAGV